MARTAKGVWGHLCSRTIFCSLSWKTYYKASSLKTDSKQTMPMDGYAVMLVIIKEDKQFFVKTNYSDFPRLKGVTRRLSYHLILTRNKCMPIGVSFKRISLQSLGHFARRVKYRVLAHRQVNVPTVTSRCANALITHSPTQYTTPRMSQLLSCGKISER